MITNNNLLMKKLITLLITLVLIFSLSACGKKENVTIPSTDNASSTTVPTDNTTPSDEPTEDDEFMDKTLILTIGTTEIEVYWLDNNSVKELKKIAKDGLTISMHKYSDFEQVGSIGSILPSNDTSITTSVGDICLYQSNQLVIFYGSNTWEYTKLGHINLTKTELVDLLGDEDVTIKLNLK